MLMRWALHINPPADPRASPPCGCGGYNWPGSAHRKKNRSMSEVSTISCFRNSLVSVIFTDYVTTTYIRIKRFLSPLYSFCTVPMQIDRYRIAIRYS